MFFTVLAYASALVLPSPLPVVSHTSPHLAPGSVGHSALLAGQDVLHSVGLAVLNVDGTDQHVVGDVVQVTTVLEPGA